MSPATIMKQGLATAAVLAALPLARAQGTTPPKTTADCNDVAIFMARGNDAAYHDTRTSPFSDATCAKLKAQGNSCDYMDIVFDATLGVPFCPTIQEGAANGVRQITEYNAKCPNTLIVINGYSQGAFVAGSTLSGGGEDACSVDTVTTGLDPNSAAGKAVKAALVWGDVKHTANQPYNVLDGASKQAWPRTGANLERLNAYSSVLRSYCAAGDPVCAGGNTVADHLNYFDLYTEEASSWVVSKLTPLLAKPATSSPSSTPAPTPTPTPSPEVSSSSASSTVAPTTTAEAAPTSTEDTATSVTLTPIQKPVSTPVTFSTMISSYVPGTTTSASSANTTTSVAEPSTVYPVTMPQPTPSAPWGNSTAPYGNSTLPAVTSSSSIVLPGKPAETPYLPGHPAASPSVPAPAPHYPGTPQNTPGAPPAPAPAPTAAPGYPVPAAPNGCPPAVVYETVTSVVYMYV
ncbi:acetylxylan esterase precursor [Pyrenophora seminiperda CCB06]|uniref:Acetylxylan esterase n=1 Tax=Pyrenophora seminiperda CCB06 TaxID=1302712 RepID=A0A3M7MBB2_9PLEO|nr:acetylxylan esterase precursor [Pyrenophora seminiperda CCB06]